MMGDEHLSGPPFLRFTTESAHEFTHRLRGSRMRTEADAFQEFVRVFAFPPYFGANWNAMDECLSDLGWIEPEEAVVLLITDADQVLPDDPEGRRILVEVLARAGEEWFQRAEGRSFHTVFQGTERGLGPWKALAIIG